MVTQQNLDLLFQVRALAGQWCEALGFYAEFEDDYFGGGERDADEIRYP